MMPPHMWPPPHGFMPPGMMAMSPGMPPFGHVSPLDEAIVMFCRQYGADASAERVLRQLHPQAQQRVLDEGPVGGANPSLELMNRVSRIEAWEHGQHIHAFLGHGRPIVEAAASEAFRGLTMEQQRAVLAFGPLMSPDPTGELMARVRDVTARASGNRGGPEPASNDEVALFASQNIIDASAEAALRGLTPDLQQKVIQEGPVRGTKNPSAVLMSRIRRLRSGGSDGRARSGSPARNAHAAPGGPGRGRRSRSRSRSRRRSRSRSKRRSRSRSRSSRSRRSRRSRSRRSRSRSRRSRSRRSRSRRSRSRRRSSSRGRGDSQKVSNADASSTGPGLGSRVMAPRDTGPGDQAATSGPATGNASQPPPVMTPPAGAPPVGPTAP